MVHEEDRTRINKAVRETLDEKKRYGEDFRIILGNGEERICRETGEVECNEAGEPVRILGTFQDITEQTKIEDALKHIAYNDVLTSLAKPGAACRPPAPGHVTCEAECARAGSGFSRS